MNIANFFLEYKNKMVILSFKRFHLFKKNKKTELMYTTFYLDKYHYPYSPIYSYKADSYLQLL